MKSSLSYIVTIFGLFFLCFCDVPEATREYISDRQFRTTTPSQLFFKNIRSSSYNVQRKEDTKIDRYTLKKFSRTADRPILYPVIVNNWLEDEAYIFIEKNNYPDFSDTISVRWESDTTAGQFDIHHFNRPNQFEFAGQLYEVLLRNYQIYVKNSRGQWVPLFAENYDRNNYLITLRDYYQLIEVN